MNSKSKGLCALVSLKATMHGCIEKAVRIQPLRDEGSGRRLVYLLASLGSQARVIREEENSVEDMPL